MRFPASSESDVDLLIPIAELGALKIIRQRLLAFAAILVALRQIKSVARDQERIGLSRERALENGGVVLILSRILAARAVRCWREWQIPWRFRAKDCRAALRDIRAPRP